MPKYKIEFDRELCIGAIACTAVAESFWPRSDDGKVDLTGSTYNEQTKKWELIIEEKDHEINKEAADVCPVDAIVIIKIDEETPQPTQTPQEANIQSTIEDKEETTTIQNQEPIQTQDGVEK